MALKLAEAYVQLSIRGQEQVDGGLAVVSRSLTAVQRQAAQGLTALQRQAADVFAATRRPEERLEAGMKQLEALRQQPVGGINADTQARAVKMLVEQFEQETGVTQRLNQERARAAEIIIQNETALDRYIRTQHEANEVLRQGHIDTATHSRESARLLEQFQQESGITARLNQARAEAALIIQRNTTAQEDLMAGQQRANELLQSGQLTTEQHAREMVRLREAYDGATGKTQQLAAAQARGAAIAQMVETAEERLARQLAELDMLARQGAISTTMLTRAQRMYQEQANMANEAMIGQGKAATRMNMMLQQASFGAQDFVQMIGPMGLAGALRASANNWAQVMAIMSSGMGIYGGLAITLASIGWATFAEGAKKGAEGVGEVADEIERAVRAARDFAAEEGAFTRDLAQQDTSSDAQRMIDRLTDQQEEITDAQKGAADEALRQDVIRKDAESRLAELLARQSKITEPSFGEKTFGSPFPGRSEDVKEWQNLQFQIEQLNKVIEESTSLGDAARASIRENVAERDELGPRIEEAVRRRDELRLKEQAEARGEIREGVRRAEMEPEVAKVDDIRKKLVEDLEAVMKAQFEPEEDQSIRGRLVAEAIKDIDAISAGLEEKPKKARQESFGFASTEGLQKQIQAGLFPKEQERAAKDTAKNTKETVEAIKDLKSTVEQMGPQQAVFGE